MKTILVLILLLCSVGYARPLSYQQMYNQAQRQQRQSYAKAQRLLRDPVAMRQYLVDAENERRQRNYRAVPEHVHVVIDK